MRAHDVVHLRAVGGLQRHERVVRVHALAPVGVGRVVAEVLVLDEMPEHVDAKAVHAALEPEAQHAEHRLDDLGIAPVQVRLLGQEGVVVVLAGGRVELPRAAAEAGEPVVRRAAARRGVAPQVPVALRDCRARRAIPLNHGCWSDVWFGTKSRISFSPRACAASIRRSKSASVPKSGSTAV